VTLYSDLGVSPSADEAAIKAAFREQAKRRHPDKGGSKEEFSKLTAAKAILLDPKRRAKYDATGEADESVDNEFAEVINCAMSALDMVLRQCETRGSDPCAVDLIGQANAHLCQQIIAREQQVETLQKGAKQIRKVAARLKSKKGKPNRLQPMFEARAVDLDRRAAQEKQAIDRFHAASKLLVEHEFARDRQDMPIGIGGVFLKLGVS